MSYCASVPQKQMFQDPPAFHPDTQTDLPPSHCHQHLHLEAESVSPHGLKKKKKKRAPLQEEYKKNGGNGK